MFKKLRTWWYGPIKRDLYGVRDGDVYVTAFGVVRIVAPRGEVIEVKGSVIENLAEKHWAKGLDLRAVFVTEDGVLVHGVST